MNAFLPREGVVRDGVYHFPVRVYYEDTDALGLVYYANYFKFAERARTEMLRQLGVEQEALRTATGFAFVVRRCTADFNQAARLDDDLVVATRLASLGGASVEFDQEIQRAGIMLVHLTIQIACIGRDGRPHRLSSELRRAFNKINLLSGVSG